MCAGQASDSDDHKDSRVIIHEPLDLVTVGLTEFYKSRDFETDAEVVLRVYRAMRAFEDNNDKNQK